MTQPTTTYTVRANDYQRRELPDVQTATERDAYTYASALVKDGATYVQVCRTERGQHVALTDWGKNVHGNTWSVGRDIPDAPANLTEQSKARVSAALSALIAACALALSLATAHAQTPDPVPAGCSIVGTTSEGFPVAACERGGIVYQDLDGAGGYDSGLPYIPPGTWRPLG